MKLAVFVGTLLLPVALAALISRSNKKKAERFRQIFQPLVALIFVVLCCSFFLKLSHWWDLLMGLPFMAAIKNWMDGFISNVRPEMTYAIVFYRAYIINCVIFLIYLLFKNVYRGTFGLAEKVIRFFVRIIRGKKNSKSKDDNRFSLPEDVPESIEELKGIARLRWELVDCFYDISGHTLRLREKWVPVVKVFKIAGILLGSLYLIFLAFAQLPLFESGSFKWFPYTYIADHMKSWYLWPAISAVLIMEIVFFLDGKEKAFETQTEEATEEAKAAERTKKIIEIKDQLEEQFPERYVNNYKIPTVPLTPEEVRPKTELTQALYDRLQDWEKQTGRKLSKSVLECIAGLTDRENATIDALLTADFGECLMLYLHVLLARGENILVLCSDEEKCREIQQYIQSSFKRINLLTPVWIVRTVEEMREKADCDVLVLPPSYILDENVINAQNTFFRNLTTVMLVDINRMIAETGDLLTAVSSQMPGRKGQDIQYIALCEGIPQGLNTTLEVALSPGREFKAYRCFSSDESSKIILWNYEPAVDQNQEIAEAQDKLFKKAATNVYLGVTVPLACTAIKNGIGTVSIIGRNIPSIQLRDAIVTHGGVINQYLGDKEPADEMINHFQFNEIDAEDPFIVVVDEVCNLPMTLHNFCRYIGYSGAIINIVSKPYMLRDFFADHTVDYLTDSRKTELFSVFPVNTDKKAVIRILSEASREEGLAEEKLFRYMEEINGDKRVSLREALEKCYFIASGGDSSQNIENHFAINTKRIFDEKLNQYKRVRRITLKSPELLKNISEEMLQAKVVSGWGEGRKETILGFEKGNVCRYYLPNQAIVVDGTMYIIDEIDELEGVIHAETKCENLQMPVNYIQSREYILKTDAVKVERKTEIDLRTEKGSQGPISTSGLYEKAGDDNATDDDETDTIEAVAPDTAERQIEGYSVMLLRNVEINVRTPGYFSFPASYPVPDLTDKVSYRELAEERIRNKKNGSALVVRFTGVEKEEADHISITLAVLLNEAIKSLFPYNWQCISVCPSLHGTVNETMGDIPTDIFTKAYPQMKIENRSKLETELNLKKKKTGEQQETEFDSAPGENVAEVWIIEDSAYDTGVLEALSNDRQNPLSGIFMLLEDYLEWQSTATPKGNIHTDYLQFGADAVPSYITPDYVRAILKKMKVRRSTGVVHQGGEEEVPTDRCCYCDVPLSVKDFILMKGDDGKYDRAVCCDCAKRCLNKPEDVKPLLEQTKKYLTDSFGVELPKGMKIKLASSSTMAKRSGNPKHKKRRSILGLACYPSKEVFVENNSPPEHMLHILAHEITHQWQYDNIDCKSLEVMEGHASYVEIQYLEYLKEDRLADAWRRDRMTREDEYGKGYRALKTAMETREDDNTFTYVLENYPGNKPRKKPGKGKEKKEE